MSDDEDSEQTPLLSPRQSEASQPSPVVCSPVTVVVILALICALAGIADSLFSPPYTKLLESIICYRYYEQHDPSKIRIPRSALPPGAVGGVEEALCKISPVQNDLARNQGYQAMFNGIPSLLTAVPLGWAADRYGRKPILLLGFFSFILQQAYMGLVMWFWQAFPSIDIIWLSSIPLFLGGGESVPVEIIFTMVSDVVPAHDRANAFLRLGAANLVPQVIAQPMAGAMLSFSPWLPFGSSVLLFIPIIILLLLLPETLDRSASSSSDSPPFPSHECFTGTSHGTQQLALCFAPFYPIILAQRALAFLPTDPRIPLVGLLFVGRTVYGSLTTILLQYTSLRYQQPLSFSTVIISVYYTIKVLFLLLILPWIATFMSNSKLFRRSSSPLTEPQKDLYLSRLSFFLLAAGWIFVGLAPTLPWELLAMPVAAAGTGPSYLVLRSFLTALVPPNHVARVYTSISMLATLGAMGAGPVLPKLLEIGQEWGAQWTGLPFLVVGLLGALILVVLCVVGHEAVDHDEGMPKACYWEEQTGERGAGEETRRGQGDAREEEGRMGLLSSIDGDVTLALETSVRSR